MFLTMDFIIGLLILVILLLFLDYIMKPRLNLPVPKRLPIIGHVLAVGKNPHIVLSEWAQKYGSMFAIQFFTEKFVVLNDYESIYECFVKKGADFAGRPQSFRTHYVTKNIDIVLQDYNQAQKLMKMRVQTLMKQYGKGMENIENIVLDMSKECVNKIFAGKSENIIDPYFNIYVSFCKTLSLLLSGDKYDESHPILKKWIAVDKLSNDAFALDHGIELDAFPWLRFFHTKSFQNLKKICNDMDDIFDFVKNDYKQIASDKKIKTVAFGLLDILETGQDESFNEERVKLALIDIIIAGTSTSSSSFYLMILILACNPDTQQKIYNEVQVVLEEKNGNKRIQLEDKYKMPYTQAFLFETQRYGSIVPLSVTHRARVDSELLGKHIPEGTLVLPNLWNLHHSEKYWEDPWSFKPERFLDKDGKLVPSDHINRKHLMPFGAGPRVCLGQSLAMARLFIFLTTLVQETCIKTVPGLDVNPDARSFKFQVIIRPEPYIVKFIKRQS